MFPDTIATFRRAVENGDVPAVISTLADDITFNTPVLFEPLRGIEGADLFVAALFSVWEDFSYGGQLQGEDTVALPFHARVGTRLAQGVDLLRFDDRGSIRELTVMVRPLSALRAFADAMGAALAEDPGNERTA